MELQKQVEDVLTKAVTSGVCWFAINGSRVCYYDGPHHTGDILAMGGKPACYR